MVMAILPRQTGDEVSGFGDKPAAEPVVRE
jgi:hypothetical protein